MGPLSLTSLLLMNMGRTFLYIKAKIVTGDKSNLNADSKVGPVNLCLHSLFLQRDVQLNGKLVSPNIPTYPYKAYLQMLLIYKANAKERR